MCGVAVVYPGVPQNNRWLTGSLSSRVMSVTYPKPTPVVTNDAELMELCDKAWLQYIMYNVSCIVTTVQCDLYSCSVVSLATCVVYENHRVITS